MSRRLARLRLAIGDDLAVDPDEHLRGVLAMIEGQQ